MTSPRRPTAGSGGPIDDEADDRRFRALVTALGRTVTDPAAGAALAADARGWLAAQGLAAEDVEVLAGYPPRRLGVYRDLVHRGIAGALRIQMPRTARRLGARLDDEVARFCALALPRSHYLRDAPRELVERLGPSWREDPSLPPFLADLARHELSAYEVAAAPPREAGVDRDALDLGRPVVLDAAVRLLRYDFPVHRLEGDEGAVEPAPTRLLASRDAEHEPRWLELSPFGAALVERLVAGEALGAAVQAACDAVSIVLDEATLGRVSALLADLAERGALLGART